MHFSFKKTQFLQEKFQVFKTEKKTLKCENTQPKQHPVKKNLIQTFILKLIILATSLHYFICSYQHLKTLII